MSRAGSQPMTEVQQYFNTREAGAFLGYALATLNIWRSGGRGPAYIKNAHVKYRREDLIRWADSSGQARKDLEAGLECHQEQLKRVSRPRGRTGAAQRERRLAAEPNCRICWQSRGVERKSVEVDHIIRLENGGSDDDSNIRCLCKGCHANVTRAQFDRSEVPTPVIGSTPQMGSAERAGSVGEDGATKPLDAQPLCRDCLEFDVVETPAEVNLRYVFEEDEDKGDEFVFYLCAYCQLDRARMAADTEAKCSSLLASS